MRSLGEKKRSIHIRLLAKINDLQGKVTEWNHKEVIGFGEGPQNTKNFMTGENICSC